MAVRGISGAKGRTITPASSHMTALDLPDDRAKQAREAAPVPHLGAC